MKTEESPRKLLNEVCILRPLLILLLVFYHAFAIYGGAWSPLDGFPEVKTYWWLDHLSYAFMLEMFVFMSGYIFGFQVRTKGESKLNAKALFENKFKRLIIPCVVFSLIYILLFQDISQPFIKTFYDVFNGVGHMWFLPMLFWCFLIIWLLEKIRINTGIALLLLIIVAICSYTSFPFQFGKTMYYSVFFYLGYIIQRKEIDLAKYYSSKRLIVLLMCFIVLFPVLTLFRDNAVEIIDLLFGDLVNNGRIIKYICVPLSNLAKLIYSTLGLALLFLFISKKENTRNNSLPRWIIDVGGLCMGVYLFQQFILKLIYNYTQAPIALGPYFLPWVSFMVALIISLLFSYLMRLTKVGRFLIG